MESQDLGNGGDEKVLVKVLDKLPAIKLTSSEDQMYSMVSITNNTVLHFLVYLVSAVLSLHCCTDFLKLQ